MEEIKGSLSKPVAVIACIAMTLFYVATLYAPTLILRLPPPQSFNNFMTRRFICAVVSSVASIIICARLLPIRSEEASYLFGVYGIRSDHIWQAVFFPLFLTSLIYAGSLMLLASISGWSIGIKTEGHCYVVSNAPFLGSPAICRLLLPMFYSGGI